MQERIPIYIAAIGPKNTTLAAEIADGWLPTLFSPEHVGEFRPLLEEGFARAGGGKGFEDFDIVPTVTAMVSDDLESARDAMRHYVALYVGGMGSRKQNFYNALVRGTASRTPRDTVQELYLEGRKDEAAAALPGELIDTLCLVGPPDVIRERLRGVPRGRRRHADDLTDGVDVRGPAGAAARGRRAGGVNLRAAHARATCDGADRARAGVRRDLPRVGAAGLGVPEAPPRLGGPVPRGRTRGSMRRLDAGSLVATVAFRVATRRPASRTSGSSSCTRRAGGRASPAR